MEFTFPRFIAPNQGPTGTVPPSPERRPAIELSCQCSPVSASARWSVESCSSWRQEQQPHTCSHCQTQNRSPWNRANRAWCAVETFSSLSSPAAKSHHPFRKKWREDLPLSIMYFFFQLQCLSGSSKKKKKKKQLAYNSNSVCMSQRRPQILTWFALREPHWEGSALYHPNLQMLWLSLFEVLRCLLKHILKESLNIFMACLWAWIFMFLKWILENIFWLDISQSLFQAVRWLQECPRA